MTEPRQESVHLVNLDDLAGRILLTPASAGATRVVAVDGPSGSGKTTMAAALSRRLGAPVVHMDDLYPGWDGLSDAVPKLLEWVLEPLAAGRPARYRRYDWDAGRYAEWHEVPDADTVVVEGVGCGARDCSAHVAELIWVEAPLSLRFERGIARDGEGYRPHWERWARQEEAHFAAEGTRERASWRITTAGDRPRLLTDPPSAGGDG